MIVRADLNHRSAKDAHRPPALSAVRTLGVLFWLACDPPGASTGPPPLTPVTDLASYTSRCAELLGALPELRCADATPLPTPVTLNGVTHLATTTDHLEAGFRCDRPSGLSRCTPGSRVTVGETDQGVPFVLVCRQYEERPDEPDGYDQIGVLASDPSTGATCFWSTPEDGLRRSDPIPTPGSAEDEAWGERSFWYTLEELRVNPCSQCHDNDPWVHTPWIHAAGIPSNPLGPYVIVAQDELGWRLPPRLVHPEAAACTTCHHLAAGRSCALALDAVGLKTWQMPTSSAYSTWPGSHWMTSFDATEIAAQYATEDAWDATWGTAVSAIVRCCATPNDAVCWEPTSSDAPPSDP